MAWYNPFSWGGGPDEVDYSRLTSINNQIRGRGERIAQDTRDIDFSVTAADKKHFEESFGFMRDLVVRELEERLPGVLAEVSGQAGARGLSGSATEATLRGNVVRGGQRDVANVLSQFGAQQAGQLAQFATQRGQNQLQRNRQLFRTLIESYAPQREFEQRRVEQEEQRIAREQKAFGQLVGGAIPFAEQSLSKLFSPTPEQPRA
jgi:hypothetical protein